MKTRGKKSVARCPVCRRFFVQFRGTRVCNSCYKLKMYGPAKVLRLRRELESLVKRVNAVLAWFARRDLS